MNRASTDPLSEWLTGELLPFGDLVSGIWLLSVLPRDKPDDYSCSVFSYKVMRGILVFGTIVDGVPEAAILLAVVTGLGVFICSRVKTIISCGQQDQGISVRDLAKNGPGFVRYMFSDGKAITIFLVNRMGQQTEWAWNNAMELVAWHTLVGMHSPFLFLLSSCCQFFYDRRFNMYVAIMFVQLVAGALTEISSIFFALMGGGTVSIVSAWFGLYSLIMSTILAVYRGNLVRKFGADASVASPGVQYGSCRHFEPLFETLCNLIPAALFGTGAAMVLFAGRYFSTEGTASSEAWVLIFPGSLLACYGFISGVLLVRHYNQTSHLGRIYPNGSQRV